MKKRKAEPEPIPEREPDNTASRNYTAMLTFKGYASARGDYMPNVSGEARVSFHLDSDDKARSLVNALRECADNLAACLPC